MEEQANWRWQLSRKQSSESLGGSIPSSSALANGGATQWAADSLNDYISIHVSALFYCHTFKE